MKREIINLLVLIVVFFSFNITVNAASLSISSSSKSVVKENKVTITVKANGLAGRFSITSSNSNVLSGGSLSEWLDNSSQTFDFTAKSTGSATITIKPIDAAGYDGNKYTTSKSVTISVVNPREKSTNNNLKSLTVEGYTISPSFNKNTLEYIVNLESNVEKIKINASKEDGYASLSGTGEKEVQEGDNKFEIIVTSETGKSKVYTVNAVVKDSNPIVKVIDKKNYTVVKRVSVLTKPDLFEATTVTINDIEIPAFYNEITNIMLIGLKDEEGYIYLYKYDAKTDAYTKYESLTSVSKTIIFEDTKEKINGYTKTNVEIDNIKYNVYQYSNNKDYVLIYGIDLETGSKNWYLYNIKEKSIQTYMSDIVDEMTNKFDKTLKEYKVVLLGMAGLSLLLLIIVIIQIVSRSKLKKKMLQKIQEKKEITNIESKEKEIKIGNKQEKKVK